MCVNDKALTNECNPSLTNNMASTNVSGTEDTEDMIPGNTLAPVETVEVGNRSTTNTIRTKTHYKWWWYRFIIEY